MDVEGGGGGDREGMFVQGIWAILQGWTSDMVKTLQKSSPEPVLGPRL